MKTRKLLLSLLFLSALTYTSCSDDNSSEGDLPENKTTSTLSSDEITTNLKIDLAVEDIAAIVNDQFEAKVGASTVSTTPAAPYTSVLPATGVEVSFVDTTTGTGTTTIVMVTTRTITITFGAKATCIFRGHNLKGQVILAHNYTTSTTKDVAVTLNNFSIDGNSIEGKATWNRINVPATTVAPIIPAHPKNTLTMIDVKYTTSAGTYIRNGWIAREMINGYATRTDLTDDINNVNIATVTLNPTKDLLNSFTIATLGTPLIYKTSCSLATSPVLVPGEGTLFITKNTSSAVIKYGTGDCDNSAKIANEIKLGAHFSFPIQYNSLLYSLTPITNPPTQAPSAAELLAKFNTKFDELATPITLSNN